MKPKPNTEYFTFFNANPRNIMACDCVVRAISRASGTDYRTVYKDLCDIGGKYCRMPNENFTYGKYLAQLGFKKQKQIKHSDGSKMSVRDFCKTVARYNGMYVLTVQGHMTCVYHKKIIDTWDCGSHKICSWWIK